MDTLIIALAPAFAAGFAVQQALELLGSFLNMEKGTKKKMFTFVSLALGVFFASMGIRVLAPFLPNINGVLDIVVTALIVSAGTEGINSVMKFLGYSKLKEQATAADQQLMVSQKEGGEKKLMSM